MMKALKSMEEIYPSKEKDHEEDKNIKPPAQN